MFSKKFSFKQLFSTKKVFLRNILIASTTLALYKYNKSKPFFYAKEEEQKKEEIVILGTGWASMSFIKTIDTDKYNVTIVSPRNYFLFTPLLASSTVGTLEARSIVQPIRNFISKKKPKIKYYEAACQNIDHVNQVVDCADVSGFSCESNDKFKLNYDKLVVAVGCESNTFGTKGVVENCFFLKQVKHSQKIRERIIDNLESASYPNITKEERDKLCHFVVVGGGPTGVEFAAELNDFKDDLVKVFPIVKDHFKISLVQSASHILNSYSESISEYAEDKFKRDSMNVITNTRVTAVNRDTIELFDKKSKEKIILPYGMCVWSTGNKMLEMTHSFAKKLPNQKNRVALITDDKFKVNGCSNIYAIGDCGTIDQNKMVHACSELFSQADANGDGKLSPKEFQKFIDKSTDIYPQMKYIAKEALKQFEKFDTSGDGFLDEEEFLKLLADADRKITALPPTAQVAGQCGEHLAKNLNQSKEDAFKYVHRGSFSYIGGSQSALDAGGYSFTGFFTYLAWSSVYWNKQVSMKNKYSLFSDWTKTRLFGRDFSRF
eukprot:gene5696-9516_t